MFLVIWGLRDPSKLKIPKGSGGDGADKPFEETDESKLRIIAGSVTNKEDVDKVFTSSGSKIDGVIVALGGRTGDVGGTMLSDGTTNIINAMKEHSVRRIVVITSIGTSDSYDQAPFFFKMLMWTVMKSIFADKNQQEDIVRKAEGIEYCIVRPGQLTVDKPTGMINVIDGQAGKITRADVASFCLAAITDDNFEYIGKSPCISSVGGISWTKDRSGAGRDDGKPDMKIG